MTRQSDLGYETRRGHLAGDMGDDVGSGRSRRSRLTTRPQLIGRVRLVGGSFDGIVLHRIPRWPHMGSTPRHPTRYRTFSSIRARRWDLPRSDMSAHRARDLHPHVVKRSAPRTRRNADRIGGMGTVPWGAEAATIQEGTLDRFDVCHDRRDRAADDLGRALFCCWLARKDSNLRSPDPESGALPLGHSPPRCPESSARSPGDPESLARSRVGSAFGLARSRDIGRKALSWWVLAFYSRWLSADRSSR